MNWLDRLFHRHRWVDAFSFISSYSVNLDTGEKTPRNALSQLVGAGKVTEHPGGMFEAKDENVPHGEVGDVV